MCEFVPFHQIASYGEFYIELNVLHLLSSMQFIENKHLSLIILNNNHLRPRQHESISVKTSVGLKPEMFSPVKLTTSTVP